MDLPKDISGARNSSCTSFLMGYAQSTTSLILTQNGLGTTSMQSFQEIKFPLTQAPVLAYFDSTKEFSIQCDACDQGLEAELLQDEKPLPYATRALLILKQDTPLEMAPIYLCAARHCVVRSQTGITLSPNNSLALMIQLFFKRPKKVMSIKL